MLRGIGEVGRGMTEDTLASTASRITVGPGDQFTVSGGVGMTVATGVGMGRADDCRRRC